MWIPVQPDGSVLALPTMPHARRYLRYWHLRSLGHGLMNDPEFLPIDGKFLVISTREDGALITHEMSFEEFESLKNALED